ncbi:MAG TPA: hypothetical protein VK755_13385 [Candidatus Acidoferrales bacterium]|nr:hypothetical protein [Candidatus Acidoferrales bacterium]
MVVDAAAYRGKAVRLRADITLAVPQNAQTLDIQFLISLSPTT